MAFFGSLYLQPRFYYLGIVLIMLFAASYFIPSLFILAQLLLLMLALGLIFDLVLLYLGKNKIDANRLVPEKFSNGDENTVKVVIDNKYPFKLFSTIIDEIPVQFQRRDFKIVQKLRSRESQEFEYTLRPVERGEYHFGNLNIYVESILRLISRRFVFDSDYMVRTYPSFKQLRKFELINVDRNSIELGLKKVRRIGHSMEFEQIKDYVLGDDMRTINWKATAKRNDLMVNLFQDEKSQPIYSIIDKGRSMQMPFNGLSLLDYAINSALVLSNVALRKHDKAGMLSFSKKVENIVAAERRNTQMQLILESLYNVQTNFFESDFSQLYAQIKLRITHRSLLFLYTNFESMAGLNRQLPYLKALAKNHLLVVVFFKNTELYSLINKKSETVQDVYDKIIAEKFDFEKRLIVNELRSYGIYSILTNPEDLTVNAINKYLEIKSRGLL